MEHSRRFKTYRQIYCQSNQNTTQPVKDQHEKVVSWAVFEVIRLQSQRVVVKEEAVQQEVESCG